MKKQGLKDITGLITKNQIPVERAAKILKKKKSKAKKSKC